MAQSYRFTDDPEQAQVPLISTLRFFGEHPQADEGRSMVMALGTLSGGARGALIAQGAGAGTPAMLGGGLARTAIVNDSQVVEYPLMLDVRLAQRQKGLVTRTTVSR